MTRFKKIIVETDNGDIEITENELYKIHPRLFWLKNADIIDAEVLINKDSFLTWKNGTWINGSWKNGRWK